MIERDLTEGKFINGLHASPEVYRGTLQSGETLYFAERTGTVEDGPNVLHRFYWGSTDRLSEVTRYRERSA
jgi:hypothetical protein